MDQFSKWVLSRPVWLHVILVIFLNWVWVLALVLSQLHANKQENEVFVNHDIPDSKTAKPEALPETKKLEALPHQELKAIEAPKVDAELESLKRKNKNLTIVLVLLATFITLALVAVALIALQ